ncbi:UNKNOWN [Stylonychia lemnae]|uniref:Uncharacterized protein n=1 Tax=Stylonychia lemnae TaxID=5949 RepID=A0A078AHY5_STYLE|nr:UNKNOWN [Stylonychia lemnae]|eukprot:CDW81859.1 UNKNOWN [Stylonychia lemnae]
MNKEGVKISNKKGSNSSQNKYTQNAHNQSLHIRDRSSWSKSLFRFNQPTKKAFKIQNNASQNEQSQLNVFGIRRELAKLFYNCINKQQRYTGQKKMNLEAQMDLECSRCIVHQNFWVQQVIRNKNRIQMDQNTFKSQKNNQHKDSAVSSLVKFRVLKINVVDADQLSKRNNLYQNLTPGSLPTIFSGGTEKRNSFYEDDIMHDVWYLLDDHKNKIFYEWHQVVEFCISTDDCLPTIVIYEAQSREDKYQIPQKELRISDQIYQKIKQDCIKRDEIIKDLKGDQQQQIQQQKIFEEIRQSRLQNESSQQQQKISQQDGFLYSSGNERSRHYPDYEFDFGQDYLFNQLDKQQLQENLDVKKNDKSPPLRNAQNNDFESQVSLHVSSKNDKQIDNQQISITQLMKEYKDDNIFLFQCQYCQRYIMLHLKQCYMCSSDNPYYDEGLSIVREVEQIVVQHLSNYYGIDIILSEYEIKSSNLFQEKQYQQNTAINTKIPGQIKVCQAIIQEQDITQQGLDIYSARQPITHQIDHEYGLHVNVKNQEIQSQNVTTHYQKEIIKNSPNEYQNSGHRGRAPNTRENNRDLLKSSFLKTSIEQQNKKREYTVKPPSSFQRSSALLGLQYKAKYLIKDEPNSNLERIKCPFCLLIQLFNLEQCRRCGVVFSKLHKEEYRYA